MPQTGNILVIGAGIAGMKASLMLAGASNKVYLVEKLPIIGGKVIKNEESFPNLECSTCMVAPIQQDVLQNPNIETLTYSVVEKIEGSAGDFSVVIRKKARYVSLTDCIGCGMCYEPCPVSLKNEWEENLIDRKAIYVPCSGSLPNVPVIDSEHCLKLLGKEECNLCVESCAFEAINLDDSDEVMEIKVGAVILATGSATIDLSTLPNLGYGTLPGVYAPMEFERLFASNGPTLGEIVLRGSEKIPESIAVIHCAGRKEKKYCSAVCCMYSFKFARFLKHKIPSAHVFNIYSDICVPGKSYQSFYKSVDGADTEMLYTSSIEDVKVSENESGLKVAYPDAAGAMEELNVDMVILAAALVPGDDAAPLAEVAGVDLDSRGFIATVLDGSGSMETSRRGVFVAGTAEGPKDIQNSVIQAESAAGQVMGIVTSGVSGS
ncbi:MAG: FAD-dependent oxidoreductase [Candidatus Aegiribacteria sp.]|nr:FAD-dependent oxidoreductase [Candidatus Aegiribacteria sp.]